MDSFAMICQRGRLRQRGWLRRAPCGAQWGGKESYPGYLGLVLKALGKGIVMRPWGRQAEVWWGQFGYGHTGRCWWKKVSWCKHVDMADGVEKSRPRPLSLSDLSQLPEKDSFSAPWLGASCGKALLPGHLLRLPASCVSVRGKRQ